MTPEAPCCAQAWAKATGNEVHYADSGAWKWRTQSLARVPEPDSAQWLAEIVEMLTGLKFVRINDDLLGAAKGRFVVAITRGDFPEWEPTHGGPDLRRALCAAFSGKPCQRKDG